ncbi:MAG: two-component sensor histidine kinase [Mesorhizobium amorphae]|nr:MAG: two-component sensor histidine kinase [Mesorhizobium amorphae]
MPKRLYARSLLIVITPMILLQSVVAFVFMERHWQLVTQRLSTATSRDIAAVVEMVETFPHDGDLTQILRLADRKLSLDVSVLPAGTLPEQNPAPLFSILDRTLSNELADRITDPFWIDTRGENRKVVEVRVQLPDKILRFLIDRSQTYASNTHIFLVWMVGTSIVLLLIAIPFLRNQVKPIAQLAEAAESFGKGRPPPEGFRPRGAEEVRRAGFAFNQMRERIERQIETRTAMLAGVSHDLRTILTRFRLQLAMGPKFIDTDALNRDVDDMQSMLQGYMDFAKGEAKEAPGDFDMEEWLARVEDEAELRGRTVSTVLNGNPMVQVRPNAFGRLLNNVVGNAFRYAEHLSIAADHTANTLTVTVDDDGPGVPPERREDVFKPFVRLDEARNLDSSGTGLGLSIARDVARSHGGDIVLSTSPLGGLRATIKVPA